MERLPKTAPPCTNRGDNALKEQSEVPETVNEDRFQRLELLIGADRLERLRQTSVAVFGVGGVGGYAVEALARGGIGRLTLVDPDLVCASNINRQVQALTTTVGHPKVAALAERCRAINPEIEIIAEQRAYTRESSAGLLDPGYDQVLDCIDQITAKLHLIESCMNRGIPIIASMGAANKLDPTLIRVADIGDTEHCRLARIMRRELRKRGIERGVPVVYSTEEFRPLTEGRAPGRGAAAGPGAYQRRRAPLGSSSFVPPLFGLTMAGEALRRLTGELS